MKRNVIEEHPKVLKFWNGPECRNWLPLSQTGKMVPVPQVFVWHTGLPIMMYDPSSKVSEVNAGAICDLWSKSDPWAAYYSLKADTCVWQCELIPASMFNISPFFKDSLSNLFFTFQKKIQNKHFENTFSKNWTRMFLKIKKKFLQALIFCFSSLSLAVSISNWEDNLFKS